MKRLGVLLLLCVAALVGLVCYVWFSGIPPKESKWIKSFYAHRAAYERLRDMLEEDGQLICVASWGVETKNSAGPSVPPLGLPVDRYHEYMELLKQVGGFAAIRGEGEPPDPRIGIWGVGFAGNTRHVWIGWMHQKPANRVATLDDYRNQKGHFDGDIAYRQIESNWYLMTDQ